MTTPQDIRRSMIKMIAQAESAHIGGNLSAVEIVHTLYTRVLNVDPERPDWDGRDRFVCKGTASALLYTVLADRGFFPSERLAAYKTDGGLFPVTERSELLPGVEASTTSMGRSLSLGIGMALAAQSVDLPYQVYVLAGDGECQEGQVWEAATLAPALGLDNLTLIVDHNGFQAFSSSEALMPRSGTSGRFAAFGWDADDVDGHDCDALADVLLRPKTGPRCVVAHTVKGRGLTFMENDVSWHGRRITRRELAQALRELR
ncbi:transketolase [Kitasatospora sp. NPDC087314]|uniref:transketolase n=1 Tax=Kitasatospora sp. NPDC087314 TaxID=3364068 RepID=UPI0038234BB3